MNKIQTFFRTLLLSLVSPKYYADVLKARFLFSFQYFLGFQLLSALVMTALIVVPMARFDVSEILNSAKSQYPQDLIVKFADGKLSVNKPLPYAVKLPNGIEENELRNLVVFSSDKNLQGANEVLAQQSLFVLTETTAYVLDSRQDGLRTYSLSGVKTNFELSPKAVDRFIEQVVTHPFIAYKLYVPTIAILLFCFVFPFTALASFIVVALYGFFAWIMSRLFSQQLLAGQLLTYGKAVQVSIHSMTLITVLGTVLSLIGQEQYMQGLWHLIAFLVWTAIVLYQAHRSEAPSSPTSAKLSKGKTAKN